MQSVCLKDWLEECLGLLEQSLLFLHFTVSATAFDLDGRGGLTRLELRCLPSHHGGLGKAS